MPKKSLGEPAQVSSGSGEHLLGTWQSAGLSMAVIVSAAWYGLGALVGVAVVGPVIYAVARLRAHAPEARNIAELIGATLGLRAGTAAGIVQLCAYLVLAAKFATVLGLHLVQLVSPGVDPAEIVSWLPAGAVVAAILAGVTACIPSTRAVASLVALLVITGVLVYVYLAVAVTARVAAGSQAVVVGAAATPAQLSGQLVVFGLGMVGVELVTVRSSRMAGPARSMSLAVVVVTVAAVVLWVGDHQGVAGPWRWTAKHLAEAVWEFYAGPGRIWMALAAFSLAVAAALASGWAAVRAAASLAVSRAAGPNARPRVAAVVLAATIAAATSAHPPGGPRVAVLILNVAPLLLMTLYVIVTEANSRIPGDSVVAWWVRLLMPALALVAVVKPVTDAGFAPPETAAVVATAVVLCAAWVTAARLASEGN